MFKPHQLLLQPEWPERQAWYHLARAQGFGLELISFALPAVINKADTVQQHLESYRSELAGFSGPKTLHGPYLDIVPHSRDRLIAEASRQRITDCLEIARQLGASQVVLHTGINWQIRNDYYFDRVVELQAELWPTILEPFPEVTISLENMWEPDASLLRRILEHTNHPRLKVCFDVGHAHVFSSQPPEAWLEELAGEIVYLHLNDNAGDRDSELALGRGNIDWPRVFAAVRQLPSPPLVTLEVNSLEAVKESLALLVREGMFAAGDPPGRG